MPFTIYFGDKPLIICNEEQNTLKKNSFFWEHNIDADSLRRLIEAVAQPEIKGAVLEYPEPETALEALKQHFVFMQAAGGLVVSPSGNLLLIFRKGKWDLPKGKLDPGETLEHCAVREVEEETGLRQIVLEKFICRTFHTYYQDGKHVLKESHWYLMQAPEQEKLTPQTEEDIEAAVWVKPGELPQYLQNTHQSVADVLTTVFPG